MEPFFQKSYKALVESLNGSAVWWHSLPLPDGNRVNGNNPDKDLQLKMWRAMRIPDEQGLAGKKVLDIGANDGFFTVAATMAGASKVTAIDKDWSTRPVNIDYSCRTWRVDSEIVSASDIYPTVAIQDKKNLALVGISNQLFPNEPAIRNLAHSYDFDCASLSGPHNAYTQENPYRQFFKLTKRG